MDAELSNRIKEVYDQYLKDDPEFQQFYSNVQSTRRTDIRQGSPDIKHELETPDFTLEAQQNVDVEKEREVEKKRTLLDVVITPRNVDEQIISAAVKSGLIDKTETQELEGKEANVSNMNGLIDVLEQRASARFQNRELERRNRQEREAESEAKEAESKEVVDKPIKREYGVMDEIVESLKESLSNNEKATTGPDSTPKEARDKAIQEKNESWVRKPE